MSTTATPAPYLQRRQQIVREALASRNLDGLLLTLPEDLAYLTDFTGHDSIGLLTDDSFTLITDFRYKEQAQIEAPWLPVVMRDGKMSETLSGVLLDKKLHRVGFEGNATPFGDIQALITVLRQKSSTLELIPLDSVLVNIRSVKDEREIQIIRDAVKVAEESFTALRSQIKVGQTENYLAGLLVFEMRKRGASDGSFPAIIGAGANSSLPHYRPGEVPVSRDQLLLIDWGAMYQGYCSDLTRTLNIGKIPPRLREIYGVVLEAQLAAIAVLKPGITTKEADRAARDVITRAGYGEQFGHGLGHGIGRQIHEMPALRKIGGDDPLKPGMIVTVEPGIYLPAEGGVRIEDDVLITSDGCQVLSSLDKSFEGSHLE